MGEIIIDAVMADKISQLAKSMKDLHLVASMEEGYLKAKEILLGTGANEELSAKKLVEENKDDIDKLNQKNEEKNKNEENIASEQKIIQNPEIK